ncbi:MAG TPA: hypothetical protein VFW00_05135 [Rhodocyclaceae bacterium]|nr:hypothetical protein [Rhodocyclaceae bacterium]
MTNEINEAAEGMSTAKAAALRVLVVDIGGDTVKLFRSGQTESRRFESGTGLQPLRFVEEVMQHVADWEYDVVSIGYPGKMGQHGPCEEPGNLGSGWIGFDFGAAFNCPVRVVNDAVLQAIGGYTGGRMLFLGLGTGLGSALVIEQCVIELDLGGLPYDANGILCGHLCHDALLRDGSATWLATLKHAVERLRYAMMADYVLLGGGHAVKVDPLPAGARRGGNEDAFLGGVRLWRDGLNTYSNADSKTWRLLR